jgi:hypothetical protein
MAKKLSVYNEVQTASLKKELKGVVDYLTSFNFKTLEDRIKWKTLPTGKSIPYVVSTIENSIETCIAVIKNSVDMIISIHSKEGNYDELKKQIDITTDTLKELQDYFFNKELIGIEDRDLVFEIGKTKKGDAVLYNVLAASSEDQIKKRGKISQDIIKILPLIEKIQSLKESVLVRGGYEIPHRMAINRDNKHE